jgi:hypothetical protein
MASRLSSSCFRRISFACGANREAKLRTLSLKVAENSTIWTSLLARAIWLQRVGIHAGMEGGEGVSQKKGRDIPATQGVTLLFDGNALVTHGPLL